MVAKQMTTEPPTFGRERDNPVILKRGSFMEIAQKDLDIVRKLAGEVAEIAASPVHRETAENWRALNDLRSVRPMVRIYQLPWREMDVDGELQITCENRWARSLENRFRQTLYQWRHMRYDMVIEPVFTVQPAFDHTGFGLEKKMEVIPHDEEGGVTSKHYYCQISDEKDIEKIQFPTITPRPEETQERLECVQESLGDILEVNLQGRVTHNYAPWDRLAEWCNPQQVLMDFVLRPDFIHALMQRLTDAYMHELDQLEEYNLLSIGSGNYGVGQGGFGFTSDLPAEKIAGRPARLQDQWGGAMAQIFSEVSPQMHEQFALKYEKHILDRFGLNYYGCCEPLHHKIDLLAANLPKLRKVSMSPWVDIEAGAAALAGRFVYSAKPNPAFLATDGQWNRSSAEKEMRAILDATEGKNVELILKDVSTVRFDPRRVWEWCDLATNLAREYAR